MPQSLVLIVDENPENQNIVGDLLLQAALLHDIGLLAVPDHVLDKPGPPDAAGRAAVQSDCMIGARAQFGPDVSDAFFHCRGDWPAVAQRHA